MADTTEQPSQPKRMPGWIILFPIGYLFVLIVLAIVYGAIGSHLPTTILHPFGQMPLSVPWFGALGGVVVSLQGIFFHNQNWSKSFNHWHGFSAVVGAIYGLVSYLFLIVILKAGTSGSAINYESALFALAAFTLGYAQQQFHALMEQVFNLLFHPPKDDSGSSKTSGAKFELTVKPLPDQEVPGQDG